MDGAKNMAFAQFGAALPEAPRLRAALFRARKPLSPQALLSASDAKVLGMRAERVPCAVVEQSR